MKIIYNNIIPFDGYLAINLFGILFVRSEYKGQLSERVVNHESIHTAQMKELWYIPFYIWYVIEWFILLFKYGDNAYRNIRFEKEAFENEKNLDYLKTRKKFNYL